MAMSTFALWLVSRVAPKWLCALNVYEFVWDVKVAVGLSIWKAYLMIYPDNDMQCTIEMWFLNDEW